jgi:hypothetical protein
MLKKKSKDVGRGEEHQGRRQALQDDQPHLARSAVAGQVLGAAQVEGQRVAQEPKLRRMKGRSRPKALFLVATIWAMIAVALLQRSSCETGGSMPTARPTCSRIWPALADVVHVAAHVGDQDRQVDAHDHREEEGDHAGPCT